MTIFRTSTYQVGNYFFQDFYDSQDQMFFVTIYTLEGRKIKKCEKCATEGEARIKASLFLEEFEMANPATNQ